MAELDSDVTYMEDDGGTYRARQKNRRRLFYGLLGVVLIIVIIIVAVYLAKGGNSSSDSSAENFQDAVTSEKIMVHLNNFYDIAFSNPAFRGSRSVLDGYNASAAYVMQTLAQQAPDLLVKEMQLYVPVWEENTTPALAQYLEDGTVIQFLASVDFQTLRYGGNGVFNFSAFTVQIDNYGCDPSDFNVLGGRQNTQRIIALIRDGGSCDYYIKGLNAENSNVSGAIIHRVQGGPTTLSSNRVRKVGWLEGDPVLQIPFFSSTYTVAEILNAHNTQPIQWTSNGTIYMAYTYNVIAETLLGNPSKTLIVGSHLDSVPAGPGLNDNGSGSSMNLQLAIEFSKFIKNPVNRVRFVWWGAEEIGLLGSYAYVDALSGQEREDVLCNLNFDMMSSPNGYVQIYNGTQVPANTSADVIAKSTIITNLFIDHYNKANIPWENAAMNGGSDYYPFIVGNLPAGALATGAGAVKTMSQRTLFGGLANAWLDPCYHQSCDTVENIDQQLLQTLASGAADIISSLAMNPDPFPISEVQKYLPNAEFVGVKPLEQ